MINSYCYSCGLFITVPDDFAGGKGTCPRCKVQLRIPKPLSPGEPGYAEGLRYVTTPVNIPPKPASASFVVTDRYSPSNQYKCPKCGEVFESLLGKFCPQGRCPKCNTPSELIAQNIKFTRPPHPATAAPTAAEAKPTSPSESNTMTAAKAIQMNPEDWDGEFLTIHPADDQSTDLNIVQAMPIE